MCPIRVVLFLFVRIDAVTHSLLTFQAWLARSFSRFDLNSGNKNRRRKKKEPQSGAERGGGLGGQGGMLVKSQLSETHGHCVLQRFAPQWRDACPSPHVTVRGATQLRGARYVRGAGERGRHSGERRLVEVGLQTGAVGGQAVGETHGVWWRARTQTALWQSLHARLTTEGRRKLQLGHSRHPRGPARVVGVEGAQAVLHGGRGRELWQARRWQQRPRGAEHIGGLLPLLPLGASVLEPNLRAERQHREPPGG